MLINEDDDNGDYYNNVHSLAALAIRASLLGVYRMMEIDTILYLKRTYDGYVVHCTVEEIDTLFTLRRRSFVMLLVAHFIVSNFHSLRIQYPPRISTCIAS